MLSARLHITPCTSGGRSSPEQALRPQRFDAPRALGEHALADDADVGEGRQQQRIGPGQDAERHAGDGAARGGAAPDQAAEERRRELRDGGEGQDADGGELRLAGEAVVHVGEQQDREDRDAAAPSAAASRRPRGR